MIMPQMAFSPWREAGAERGLIDSDSHVSEPLNLWQERLEKKYRDRAPRMVTEYEGEPGAWWLVEEGRRPNNVILGFGVDKTPEELAEFLKSFSYAGAHAGGWDPAQRLKDMEQDGVEGGVLYTTLGFRMFWLKDAGFQRDCFRVYNDWLGEFVSYAPKRLKGPALISLYDPKQGAQELERCAKMGLKGAMIWASPPEGLSYSSAMYDPFWAKAQELDMPLSLHEMTGLERALWESSPQNRAMIATVAPHEVEKTFSTLILAGILERFPRLKIVSVEINCGWLPNYLYRVDKGVGTRASRVLRRAFAVELTLKPSEYFHRQMYATFIDDPFGLAHRHEIGVDNLMWSTDYPHSASFWPHSREKIARDFKEISEEEKWKMVSGNVAKLFGFDLS